MLSKGVVYLTNSRVQSRRGRGGGAAGCGKAEETSRETIRDGKSGVWLYRLWIMDGLLWVAVVIPCMKAEKEGTLATELCPTSDQSVQEE